MKPEFVPRRVFGNHAQQIWLAAVVALLVYDLILGAAEGLSTDGLALLEFKSELESAGNVFSALHDWSASDASPCNWTGVSCSTDSDQRVTSLNLFGVGLAGRISPSLGKLEGLQVLDLSTNALFGDIPPELGNCSSLKILFLDTNNLNGTIPHTLGDLQELQQLNLSSNLLSGNIPPELGNCSRLNSLDLDTNVLDGSIPPSLGNLHVLQNLILSWNNLSGAIPPELAACSSLQILDLESNQLTGSVPQGMYNISSLVSFFINNNALNGDITPGLELLAKLPNITDIWMQCNRFTGSIPAGIGEATTLQTLILNLQVDDNGNGSSSGNGFGGFLPKELGLLQNLYILDISNNDFTGSIPPELGSMTNLQYLYLSTNKLTGSIPAELGNLTNLICLYLYTNSLTGTLPAELRNLKNLTEILVYSNNLSGTIPPSLGELQQLDTLDIHSNSFIGTLPLELFNCTTLTSLYISENNFSGTIPSQIGNLRSLLSLRVQTNQFTGPIPEEIGDLVALKELIMSSNDFSGSIPASLADMNNLSVIYLYNNQLSGAIPSELGMKSNLTQLDLRNNLLSGSLPPGLCSQGFLKYLDVSHNSLEGGIPLELASCVSLFRIEASFNFFTSIPDSFGKGTELSFLDLSNNRLLGPFPSQLGFNSNLSNLALANNGLSGDLSPLQCSSLPNLQSINLAFNHLEGAIPSSLASCNRLFRLDLSFNSFNGSVPSSLPINLQVLHLQGNQLLSQDPSIYTSLKNLNDLNLAQNEFKGSIPPELAKLDVLTMLNLSFNQFSGIIPIVLGSLQALEVLDLSYNQLSGTIPLTLGQILSLESVNVSYNELNGSLPPSWVKKLLASNSSSFVGNPGLCLNYSAENDLCQTIFSNTSITSQSRKKDHLSVGVIVSIVFSCVACVLGCVVLGCCFWRGGSGDEKVMLEDNKYIEVTSSPGSDLSFSEIMVATRNLSDDCIIGKGSHGTVYKAVLPNGNIVVVKKVASLDKDLRIHKSFLREIDTIGNAKHRNLVKLLGFCKWGEIGLLLYDYVPNGNLFEALHNHVKGLVLDWEARLKIAEGIAQGLAYLHDDYIPPIIHRDIKSSNVLLDEDLEPHIGDFGIAKVMALQPRENYASSTAVVAGTHGYIAPEYGYGTSVTEKVDVYSYGVVLLELLIGKQPVDLSFGESMHIVAWVRARVQQNGGANVNDVLDSRLLMTTITDAQRTQMLHVLRIAILCTKDAPSDRPTMRNVLDLLRTSKTT
jgi:Leucine-rich repeat (LRR) protein